MGEVSQLGLSGDRRNLSEAVDSGFDWGIAAVETAQPEAGDPNTRGVWVSDLYALAATLSVETRDLQQGEGRHEY